MRPVWLLCLLLVAVPAGAGGPDVGTIVGRMKSALEPDQPSTRRLVIAVTGGEGATSEWTAAQARKRVGGSARMMTVVLTPDSLRGAAFLIEESAHKPDRQWLYLPVVRRVREIVPVQQHEYFLNTDFTYADLGFVSRAGSYRLRGTETQDGKSVYRIEETPRDKWYYGRIVTWVASDSWLPTRREFYDPAGTLWKVERFENPTVVDGVMTPLLIRMEDVLQHGSSEIRVSGVRYGADVPDDLFEPRTLAHAADRLATVALAQTP